MRHQHREGNEVQPYQRFGQPLVVTANRRKRAIQAKSRSMD